MYDCAVKLVKSERPELLEKMTKSFGFAMGVEFREGSLLISGKTNVPAKKGKSLIGNFNDCCMQVNFTHSYEIPIVVYC